MFTSADGGRGKQIKRSGVKIKEAASSSWGSVIQRMKPENCGKMKAVLFTSRDSSGASVSRGSP